MFNKKKSFLMSVSLPPLSVILQGFPPKWLELIYSPLHSLIVFAVKNELFLLLHLLLKEKSYLNLPFLILFTLF